MPHARLDRHLWPSFGLFLLFSSPSLGCGSDVGREGASPANPLDPVESTLLSELNGARAEVGAPPLTVCRSLNVSAAAHSDEMQDQGYLDDVGKDGSTPRDRACQAGYQPACDNVFMAELVASGSGDPVQTVGQWKGDAESKTALLEPNLKFAGVGVAYGEEEPVWTVDLGADDDPSCP
jgi:uncharacterized protein YkwD